MLGRQRPGVALLDSAQHLRLTLGPVKDWRRLSGLRRIQFHLRDFLSTSRPFADQLEQLTVNRVNTLSDLTELFIRVHGVSPRRVPYPWRCSKSCMKSHRASTEASSTALYRLARIPPTDR